MRRCAVLVVVLAAATFASLPSADAEEHFAPTGGTFTVVGHGWGHGKGMSQFGALQAANLGVTHPEILNFYYPSTAVGSVGGHIRVRIDGAIRGDITVYPSSGLRVVDLGNGAVHPLFGGQRYRIRVDPATGAQDVDRDLGAAWEHIGTLHGRGRFDADAPTTMVLNGGAHFPVRGSIEAVNAGAALWPVNILALEHYLYGVVPKEVSASWPVAALRAQAVAARSYAASERHTAGSDPYDICSTTSCQVYAGFGAEQPGSNAAIDATAGEIRTYNGVPAFTQFSSSNGGWVAPGSLPYQQARQDHWDWASSSPNRNWTVNLTVAQVQQAFPSVGQVQRIRVLQRDGQGDYGGRVVRMAIDGTAGSASITGDQFRSAFGLRSTYFSFTTSGILLHWGAIGGGSSVVGNPTSDEYDVPGGRAQNFQFGVIYWSPPTGAREVHGGILARFRAVGATGSVLRFPVTDEFGVPGGAASHFQGGGIYWSPANDAKIVRGGIFAKYLAVGGAARLGVPITDEVAVQGGQGSRFTGGAIYWNPSVGAQSIEGGINAHYQALGGPAFGLGLPTADEADGGVPGSRVSVLQFGRIYWSAATGAHEVHGGILARYLAEGGPTSALGLPITDEQPIAGGARSTFQGGTITWSAATNSTTIG